jgi:hypothetical protein
MKKISRLVVAILLLLSSNSIALAVDVPSFPSCVSPFGTLRVEYSNGTHGIVGSGSTYTGSDTVYQVSDTTLTQCFCSSDGVGIQTNWWKASSLSENQIDVLKAQGWHYVPAGDLWGLEAAPYVAKNISYACLPNSSSTPTPNSSSSSSSSVGGDGQGGGSLSEGSVLGLAATGDSLFLYLLASIALSLIFVGLKRSRHEK